MNNPSFIVASYVLTAVAIGVYAVSMLRAARRHDRHATDEDKPWT